MEELATGLGGIEILWLAAATILPGIIDGIRKARKHAANRANQDSFAEAEEERGNPRDQAKVVAFRSRSPAAARHDASSDGLVERKDESHRQRAAHS